MQMWGDGHGFEETKTARSKFTQTLHSDNAMKGFRHVQTPMWIIIYVFVLSIHIVYLRNVNLLYMVLYLPPT
jgi:hypothetical protein